MLGRELAAVLEREGFSVARRSRSYVWLERGRDSLLVDLDADIEDEVANQLLERARRAPP